MKKHRLSGKFTAGLVSLLLAVCLAGSAMSCSLFYFGGDWTDDGALALYRQLVYGESFAGTGMD